MVESDLRRLFEPYGPIAELVVLRDKHTNAHRGCAFLTYLSRQSADDAISGLHERISLHNRPIVVRYAGQANAPMETKLFVGMLSRQTGEEAISALFSQFGLVKEVYLMRDSSQLSKGCAFVKMQSREEAINAIEQLNEQHQDAGAPRKLVVRFADSKAARGGPGSAAAAAAAAGMMMGQMHMPGMYGDRGLDGRGGGGIYGGGMLMNGAAQWGWGNVPQAVNLQHPYASLYAAQAAQAQAAATLARQQQQSSLSRLYPAAYYTREQQQQMQQQMQHMQMQQHLQQQQQHGGPAASAAALQYADQSAAAGAQSAAQQQQQLSPPSPFAVSAAPFNLSALSQALPSLPSPTLPAHHGSPVPPSSLSPPTSSLSSGSSSPSPARGPYGANLFIYNIPDSYADADLVPLFSPYGQLISTKVYRDKLTGLSRGFGFVSFVDGASAEKAIASLNGVQLAGKRLKVMLKKQGAAAAGGGGGLGGGGGGGAAGGAGGAEGGGGGLGMAVGMGVGSGALNFINGGGLQQQPGGRSYLPMYQQMQQQQNG